jgi:hypothetical protein
MKEITENDRWFHIDVTNDESQKKQRMLKKIKKKENKK